MDLRNRSLTDEDMEVIISFLKNHPEITILNLGGCEDLTPKSYVQLPQIASLEELYLGKGSTHCTPEGCDSLGPEHMQAFGNNTTLKKLSLWGHKILDKGALILANNHNLEYLNLGHNELTDIGALAILKQMPHLSVLQLDGRFTLETAKAIANAKALTTLIDFYPAKQDEADLAVEIIASNQNLQYLSMWNVGDLGLIALAKNTSIKKLYIHNGFFTEKGMQALAATQSITSLLINGYDQNAPLYYQYPEAMIAPLGTNETLQSLWINLDRGSVLKTAGIQSLLKNKALRKLELGCMNNLNDDAAKTIATYGKQLTSLRLDYCNIGVEGVKAIAQMPSLVELDLFSNLLGDEGAEILSKNITLRNLTLANTYLHDKGALALAQTRTLETLDVRMNKLTQASIYMLSNNPYIKNLYYSVYNK